MATITGRSSSASTTNTTSYASASFTPAVGDLLVFMLVASDTASAGSITSSEGYTFTKVQEATLSTTNRLYVFVANSLVTAAVSQTLTFTCTDDAATGCFRVVASISGMSRTGASAVRQSAARNSGSSGTTPAVALGAAALTGNPLIALLSNLSNPANIVHPSGWSEQNDSGFSTPTTGFQYANINSGFTGSTVTWGGTSGTNYCALAVEFDTSAVAQTIQPSLFSNSSTIYSATVSPGAVTLTPARYDSAQTFYTQTISQVTRLQPGRYDSAQTFFGPTVVRGAVTLLPPLYGNVQAFYTPAVARGAVTISASRLDNAQTFYTIDVTQGGPSQTLLPAKFDNTQTFYGHTVTALASDLRPPLLTNTQTFYGPQINQRIGPTPAPGFNVNQLFAPAVSRGVVTLQPLKFDNSQFFYPPFVGDEPPPDDGRKVSGGMLQNMGTLMNR